MTGILISHISEESELAKKLKDWIETTFAGQCDVFVSSDSEDIPPGAKWLEKIGGAMASARVLILIASPTSIARPWINFEAGCGWIKNIPIIPVCHSGQRRGSLPRPLSDFQALEVESAEFSKDLIEGLAKHLSITKVPRINYGEMNSELLEAASSIVQPVSGGSTPATAAQEAISSEQLEILRLLSQSGSDRVDAEELASYFKRNFQKIQYDLGVLDDLDFVDAIMHVGGDARYFLSQKGRAFLVSKGLL